MGVVKRHMIEVWERGWEDLDGEVCSSCLADAALILWIREEGHSGVCRYCGSAGKVVAGNDLMERVADGLAHEWGDADTQGIPYDGREGGYQAPLTDLDEIFWQVGWPFSNDELAEAVIELFADVPRVSKYVWSLSPSEMLRWGWERFVEFTKHEARYLFLSAPTAQESESWDEIPPAEMLDRLGGAIVEAGLINIAPIGTRFVRARTNLGDEIPLTHEDLGPPRREHARSSNRMSAAGIPMFYGATDTATAESEVLAAHTDGVKAVTTGEFQSLRPLHLVDLGDIPPLPSIFDERRRHLRGPIAFLEDFAVAIAGPVSVDEVERVDYVPTQIVTEYIRHVLPTRSGLDLDGLLYRSAQLDGGINVVLFVEQDQCVTLSKDADVTNGAVLGFDPSSVRRRDLTEHRGLSRRRWPSLLWLRQAARKLK